jgi:hypothetical protein
MKALRLALCVCALIPPTLQASDPQQGGDDVCSIGSRLELFVDDYLIESMTNLTQTLHHPQRRETVLTFDRPWEGGVSSFPVVFQDGDIYRLYYYGMAWGVPSKICYAESRDGITWTRPNLGLCEFDGSTENNIIISDPPMEQFAPFKDPNPAAPESQRYKAIGYSPPIAFCSPDGIHWNKIQEEPVLTKGAFDSLNLAFWDPLREEYVAYFRTFDNGVRHISTCTSKDFIHWTDPVPIDLGDGIWQHLYTNAVTPYFRAPHIYMGFPMRLHETRAGAAGAQYTGVSDGVFMTSRDGVRFRRWVEAFVRPGTDQQNWVHRTLIGAWGMLALSPEEISLYYDEHYDRPTNHLQRYTIRTDGFVSINAKYQVGELLTKPLTFEGRALVINYSTSAVGSVQVEIQNADGTPVEGFTLADCPEVFGDEIERVVAWKGGSDVSALAGRPIRLRFVMKDADLYSMRFRP